MAIRRAWYVACDLCGGEPTAISTEGANDARRTARREGYVRQRVRGQMVDLCWNCKPHGIAAEHPGGDTQ